MRHCQARREAGFTLVETLVVMAIIGILMAMMSTALMKALRMAKGTATAEAMHQNTIADMAEGPVERLEPREAARAAYRQTIDYGKGESLVTQVIFVVRTDDEFRAYWNTLINPNNVEPLRFGLGGALNARKGNGEAFLLPPVGDGEANLRPYPVAWEFISTDLSETAQGNLGGNVVFNAGDIHYIRYGQEFPMTKAVAKLSHRFVIGE